MRPAAFVFPLLAGALLNATLGFACDETNPALCDVSSCLHGPLPAPLVVLARSGMSVFQVDKAIGHTCADLMMNWKTPNLGQRIFGLFGGWIGVPLMAEVPTMIEQLFGGSEALKTYERQLTEIGKIENRFERIRRVYELAASNEGAYEENLKISKIINTPGQILSSVREQEPGGQCRDFALLLRWSLLQVQKSPTLSAADQASGALDENSFSVQEVTETVLDGQFHAWVEVRLPVGTGENRSFHTIQLDTTWYKDVFTPLYPRNTDLGDREQLLKQCNAISHCIGDLVIAKLPQRSPEPVPACPK